MSFTISHFIIRNFKQEHPNFFQECTKLQAYMHTSWWQTDR